MRFALAYSAKILHCEWMQRHRRSTDQAGGKGRNLWTFLRSELSQNFEVIMSLGVRAASVLAGFVVTYQIGHNLGAEATGQFALVTQTALFLAIVGLMGLDISVVRHFAKSVADGNKIAFTSLFVVVASCVLLMVVLSALIWAGGGLVWTWLFADSVPSQFLLVLSVLLVGRAGARLFGGLLRSQHMFSLGQIVPALIVPLFTAVALATGMVDTIGDALWASALGGLVALAVGAVASFSRAGFGSNATHISLKAVVASSVPLWGVGVAQNLADWYGLAVATHVLTAVDTGLYRVSLQVAAVLQIASMALFSVYSAKISTAFHANDRPLAAKLAASAVRFSSLLAVPMGALLILGGPFLLAQIGPAFEPAYPVLIVLVLGQVAFTMTGPCGLVLAMSGNEKVNLSITVASTLLLLVLLPISAQMGGLLGLAICVSLVSLVRNIVAYIVVYRREGIHIWSGKVRIMKGASPE